MNIMNYASRKVTTIEPRETIDKAISLMEEHSIRHLVVTHNGRPIGMLSDRDILISTGWTLAIERTVPLSEGEKTVIGPQYVEQIMSRPLATLMQSSTAQEAASLINRRKISAVPILNHDRLVGLLTDTDLINWLDQLAFNDNSADRLLRCDVRELMRAHVISVGPGAGLAEVVDLFRRFRIRHVAVVVESTLLGIISDRDVRRCLGWSSIKDGQGEIGGKMFGPEIATVNQAAGIMQTNVQSIGSRAPLRAALRKMLEHRIHSLPVIDEAGLVGMITQTDFIKAIARNDLL
jgi:CBS domain-containing protein